MKFLKFLIAVQLAWALSGAVSVHADDIMDIPVCAFSVAPSTSVTGKSAKEIAEDKVAFQTAYDNAYNGHTGTCGEPNSAIGDMIEKRDCADQVITEITEVVTTADTPLGEDKIVNLYQGVCCYLYDSTSNTCYQTTTYYTADYSTCSSLVDGTPVCSQRQWLIASSGMGLLRLYVKQIYTFGATAVGFIAMAMLIYYGIRISASGVSGDISEYKQKIMQAISGIVLLFLSALILYTVNPDFFG